MSNAAGRDALDQIRVVLALNETKEFVPSGKKDDKRKRSRSRSRSRRRRSRSRSRHRFVATPQSSKFELEFTSVADLNLFVTAGALRVIPDGGLAPEAGGGRRAPGGGGLIPGIAADAPGLGEFRVVG